MKDSVTLKELLAFVIRKGKLVVVLALVCAIALGAVMAFRQVKMYQSNTMEMLETEYQQALQEYNAEVNRLEMEIADSQWRLENQEVYNANSLLMQIDPYHAYEATVYMVIADVDPQLLSQFTSMEYLVGRIVSQYMDYWNGLVLQDALENNPFPDSEEKYLRELFTITRMEGGGLMLKVTAAKEADATALADAAWKCLQEAQSLVQAGAGSHRMVKLSQNTKVEVNAALEKQQKDHLASIHNYKSKQAEAKNLLEHMKAPAAPEKDVATAAVKSGILGVVLGGIVAAVLVVGCLVCVYFFRGSVETSRELEQGMNLHFLGSATPKKDIFGRMADGILQERSWQDPQQALAYISGNLRIKCGSADSLVVLTTLREKQQGTAMQTLVDTLTAEGWKVRCIRDVSHNAEAAAAISGSQWVLLAERPGLSNWNRVVETVELTKRLGKEICGFVTV